MKRIISIILGSLFIFSGCNQKESSSIGIIGGADGPTAVYLKGKSDGPTAVYLKNNNINNNINENDSVNLEKKPVRMINVKGSLYYDTGKARNLRRCGTLDGNLINSENEYEIPQNDGDCNFEAEGYQYFSKTAIDVPIDSDWVVFKKIDETEKNLLEYKYCYYLKGKMPNAESESELVVLANDKELDFTSVTKSLYSSLDDSLDVYIVPILPEDKWGINLTEKDVTNKGLTICCEQLGGSPSGELYTSDWFEIEIYNNGNWEPVKKVIEDVGFNNAACLIDKDRETEWEIDWEWLYGELSPGVYRISKKIYDFREAGDFDKETYYLSFTISNT